MTSFGAAKTSQERHRSHDWRKARKAGEAPYAWARLGWGAACNVQSKLRNPLARFQIQARSPFARCLPLYLQIWRQP